MNTLNDSEARAKIKTILLIEDEELHAELIRRIFKEDSSEWEIHHLASLDGALKWLEENKPPSLIISDYFLPDGTGLDLIKEATSLKGAGIPFIILTGFDSERLAIRSFKLGAFLVKSVEGLQKLPWTAKHAIREWENIIRRRRAEEERERLFKELEAKNAELERFTYTVSHNLRSPLITIEGSVGLLREDLEQNQTEKVKSDLEYIESATTKMDGLLKDTLKLARIGRVINPPEGVPYGEIVKEALEQTSAKLSGVEVSVAEDFPVVLVDRLRILEVLVNLIENSINYMGEQPRPKIDIGYRMDGEEAVFFVKDNGIGIAPSQHEKVFELFYQIEKNNRGTGAGLAIVKRIIEVHNGRVWMESEEGKGCAVCFTLPIV